MRQTRKRSLLNEPKTQFKSQDLEVGVYSSEVEKYIITSIIKLSRPCHLRTLRHIVSRASIEEYI